MFTIFLIDDDAEAVQATSRMLRAKGYVVQPFLSPQKFLASHDSAIPGCVVIEATSPRLDGLKLQRALIKLKSRLPVIFLTSKPDIPTCVQAMKAGATDFLTKPPKEEDLLAALEAAKKRVAKGRRTDAGLKSMKARFATLRPNYFAPGL